MRSIYLRVDDLRDSSSCIVRFHVVCDRTLEVVVTRNKVVHFCLPDHRHSLCGRYDSNVSSHQSVDLGVDDYKSVCSYCLGKLQRITKP